MDAYKTNTKVRWPWGDGFGTGYVREVHRESISRTIKGTEVIRNGSKDDPVYLIEQADGDEVLKLHSEVERNSD